MINILFLKGVQLAKIKKKFSETDLFYENLKKKHKKLINKEKIVIKLQKLRNK